MSMLAETAVSFLFGWLKFWPNFIFFFSYQKKEKQEQNKKLVILIEISQVVEVHIE